VAREVLMLVVTEVGLRVGIDLKVNMLGRWAVWPTMSAIGLAMITETWLSDALLYLGLAMTLAATVVYLQDGWRQLRARRPSSST
jgi:phosphatidylglycerophosphate synthase